MPELTAPVDLCAAGGSVNPAALGWSRRPLHRCNLGRPWGRRKRWHHWCVTSPRLVLTMTLADLDYLGLGAVMALDLESGRTVERLVLRRPRELPEIADGGVAEVAGALSFHDEGARVRLEARGPRVEADVEVERPAGHETFTVAVAWSSRRFQLTSKQNALRARGRVRVDGTAHELEDAFACLDFGRGVWPARTVWNWASASGLQGGRLVGLNLGARWTDGTGENENAVCIDGRIHKLGDVAFRYDRRDFRRPWRLTGGEVDLAFTPRHEKAVRGGLITTHVCFGHFSGAVAGVELRELLGWAEDFAVVW